MAKMLEIAENEGLQLYLNVSLVVGNIFSQQVINGLYSITLIHAYLYFWFKNRDLHFSHTDILVQSRHHPIFTCKLRRQEKIVFVMSCYTLLFQ